MEFEHPHTGQTLEFLAPVPSDLQGTLNKLSERRIGLTDFGREVLVKYCSEACGVGLPDGYEPKDVDSFTFLKV